MFEDRIPKQLNLGDIIDGEQLRYFEGRYGRLVISDFQGRGSHLKYKVVDVRKVYHVLQDDRLSRTIPQPIEIEFYEVRVYGDWYAYRSELWISLKSL